MLWDPLPLLLDRQHLSAMVDRPSAANAAVLAAALLLALAAPLPAAAAPVGCQNCENVLERFPTAPLRWVVAGGHQQRGVSVTYNTTKLRRSGQWVSE